MLEQLDHQCSVTNFLPGPEHYCSRLMCGAQGSAPRSTDSHLPSSYQLYRHQYSHASGQLLHDCPASSTTHPSSGPTPEKAETSATCLFLNDKALFGIEWLMLADGKSPKSQEKVPRIQWSRLKKAKLTNKLQKHQVSADDPKPDHSFCGWIPEKFSAGSNQPPFTGRKGSAAAFMSVPLWTPTTWYKPLNKPSRKARKGCEEGCWG